MKNKLNYSQFMGLYIILEFLLIVVYMYKEPILGIIIWLLIMKISINITPKEPIGYLVAWLIASIPVSYLEITCEIGSHIFKIFHFCIVFLVLYLLKELKWRFSRIAIIICIMLFLQLFRNMFLDDFLGDTLISLFQEWIIVIPICLFYSYIKTKGKSKNYCLLVRRWSDCYFGMAVASAVGVLYQYIMMKRGVNLGYITFFPSRTVYDMTFTGYSVLSVVLGAGIVIAVDRLLLGFRFVYMMALVLCACACAVNSSRSGLFAAFVIVAIQLLQIKKRITIKKLFLFVSVAVIAILTIIILINNRESIRGKLLNDNGRIEILFDGIRKMSEEIQTFLFGVGASHVGEHNMFLEFFIANGCFAGILFLFFIGILLIKTRKSSMNFLGWHIFLSHQFFTSFFATTFLLPVLILLLAGKTKENGKQPLLHLEKNGC